MLVRAYSRRYGSFPVEFNATFAVRSDLTPAQAEHGQMTVEAGDPDGDEVFMIMSEAEALDLKSKLEEFFAGNRIEGEKDD